MPMLLDDRAACHGHIRINKQPLGLCVNCGRYDNGTPPTMEPAATLGVNGWDCPNRRSLGALIDAETVDAVDDIAGLHAPHRAPAANVTAPLDRGNAGFISGGEVAASTRAGEGG